MGLYETQLAIAAIKRAFEDKLSVALNLKRVSAPLFVLSGRGLNDDLSGVERPVSFDVPAVDDQAEVVHSLAKWKRLALSRYGFEPGVGLYTDMNAIRRDEELDNVHSIYVDQWDWERVITRPERDINTLRRTVKAIAGVMSDTADFLRLPVRPPRDVFFIDSQDLEDMYPELTPEQREIEIAREHKLVFITGLGGRLRSGVRHSARAPDYDDWSLNGDLIMYSDLLGRAVELSSMGVRVDAEALDRQLTESNADSRRSLPFHSALLANELPLTMGGGIGQSRLCMLLLDKAHIGEVQVSVWDAETANACERAGITLL